MADTNCISLIANVLKEMGISNTELPLEKPFYITGQKATDEPGHGFQIGRCT